MYSLKTKIKSIIKIFFKNRIRTGNSLGFNEASDQKLLYSLSPQKIPGVKQLKHWRKVLNFKERLWFISGMILVLIGIIWGGTIFIKQHLQVTPRSGGEYREGIVGSIKYLNPLYNFNRDADSDLSYLIYSALFKRDENGKPALDLVESYEVVENGLVYNLKLRQGVKFHDGSNLTADDVVFTFNAIVDPAYNSSWRNFFPGVSVEKIDDYQVRFVLSEAYVGFPNLLTFGILPQAIWSDIDPANAALAELNLTPIGSGPFKFKALTKTKTGEIKEYDLIPHESYYEQKPYLDQISFFFFQNNEDAIAALNDGQVDGLSYLNPADIAAVAGKNSFNFHGLKLAQVNSILWNNNLVGTLASTDVRQALGLVIDRQQIISDIYYNQALIINGPLPAGSMLVKADLPDNGFDVNRANSILDNLGYQLITINSDEAKTTSTDTVKTSIIDFAISKDIDAAGDWRVKLTKDKKQAESIIYIPLIFVETPENNAVAQAIAGAWTKLGVKTKLIGLNNNDFASRVMKNHDFQAVLSAQLLNADSDPFVFWHSGQSLNISGYKNTKVDALLESGRLTGDNLTIYADFQDRLVKDSPAIFLFSPNYIYLQSKKIKGFSAAYVAFASDRFYQASHWYINTTKKLIFKKS